MKKRFFILIVICLSLIWLFPRSIRAASCEDSCEGVPDDKKVECLEGVRAACEAKLAEVREQKTTLQSTIDYLNGKIRVTQAQINQTQAEIKSLEKEIESLSGKIDVLNVSLDRLTQLLINRVVAMYKSSKVEPVYLLLTSSGFSDFLNRYQYLRVTQQHDRRIIFEMEEARANYDFQKTTKEEKQQQVLGLQTELVSQRQELDSQKSAKQQLLEITKNDERRFQELLAKTRAEFEAIQNILAGAGQETKIGDVNEGEKIASIIAGSSCNSSGTHLHFTITQGNNVQNPFNYLKGVDHENCSGSTCGNSDGDPFNPVGNWSWPIDSPVELTQGFGSTWAVKNTWVGRIYSFHNGIDIVNPSLNIKAVQAGTLYRGSFTTGSGCTLRYVRVDHKDSDVDSWYLHVNYVK